MLPQDFLDRMQKLLGEEYGAFYTALSEEENVHAIRCNQNKLDRDTLCRCLAGHLMPISYTQDGFFCDIGKIGNHPLHHAGAIYSQDPGAMAPIECVDIQPGWLVADFCASPGGKSIQLAAKIGEEGVLLSNEISSTRCRVLAGNIERMGIPNAIVTNVSPAIISEWFPSYFDLVLVDAPCSGEGMFRKYDVAQTEWNPSLVPMCAERQAEILDSAAKTVRTGGYLLYSTCTFSVEENEGNIDAFLERNPAFTVCNVSDRVHKVTADGVAFLGAHHSDALRRARRFYPHLHSGEGQFMCLLRKTETQENKKFNLSDSMKTPKQSELALVEAFLNDVLAEQWKDILPNYKIGKQNDIIYLIPQKAILPPHSVYLSGVAVGKLQKGRIEPHHQFFSAMGKYFKRKLCLTLDSADVSTYLHGGTLPTCLPNGYAVLTVEGAAIGGIKVVDGVAKNHYPKGLRTPYPPSWNLSK